MSGELDLGTEKEQVVINRVAELDKILDEYLATHGVGNKAYGLLLTNESEPLLKLSRDDIRHMSPQECNEAAYVLGRLSLSITTENNKQKARMEWCKSQIDKTIATQINDYKDYSYEAKKNQAIKANDYARKLNDIRIQAEARYNSLAYVAKEVQFLANLLKDQRWIKNDENRNS